MRVLILGGGGMLGHMLWREFPEWCECAVTVRAPRSRYTDRGCLPDIRVIDGIDAMAQETVTAAIANYAPDVVVNCIGIVKQSAAAKDPLTCIKVNSELPHVAQQACESVGARLIHLSTDCVFSGKRGNYDLTDNPDPVDLYGRSKLLGEVTAPGALTMRTSMIGRELAGSQGLVEWFLGQEGRSVSGYKKAVFSGFTTLALSLIIKRVILERPMLQGLWHVASEPIDKFTLLGLVRSAYGLSIEIEPEDETCCDRSLNAEAFRAETGFAVPSWRHMIECMAADEQAGGYGLT